MHKNILIYALLFMAFAQVKAQTQDTTTLDQDNFNTRWETTKANRKGTFLLTPYKPVYFLVGNYSNNRNQAPKSINPTYQVPDSNAANWNDVEFKFQISFKSKIIQGMFWNYGDLWMAYSQTSRWQIYNQTESRPFRETNYEPELIVNFPINVWVLGLKMRMVGVAFNHQSNGRSLPLSRSWNRIIGHLGFDTKTSLLELKAWYRLNDTDDENPEIMKYIGATEIVFAKSIHGHQISVNLRQPYQIGFSKGSIQADYSLPISGRFKAHLQIFHGYGESLIDYNHKQITIGLGFSLINWL